MNLKDYKNTKGYKVGAMKRKLKITRKDKVEPGDMISRMNKMKRTAVMGLV